MHVRGADAGRTARPSRKDAGVVIECIGIAGSRDEVDEKILKRIASPDETGRPRYCFISDTSSLIKKYKSMANQIRPV